MRVRRLVVAAIAAAAVVIAGCAIVFGIGSVGPIFGCGAADRDLAVDMGRDPAFESLPSTFHLLGPVKSDCEPDSRVASSRAGFQITQSWETAREAAYAVFQERGWEKLAADCFIKIIDGHRVVTRVARGDVDGWNPGADLTISQYGFTRGQANCNDWY